MHEWALTRALLREIERIAAAHGEAKVLSARVKFGAPLAASVDHLRLHFSMLALGTVAEGAELKIEVSQDPKVLSGAGFLLESIELAD